MIPEPPSPDGAIPAIREELARVRAAMQRIEAALTLLENGPEPERPARARTRPDRYYLVLLGVYERGRQGVDSEQFGRLGAEHGYDRRGLGGYFVGARASLRRDGDRIHLTAEGLALIDEYLEAAQA